MTVFPTITTYSNAIAIIVIDVSALMKLMLKQNT